MFQARLFFQNRQLVLESETFHLQLGAHLYLHGKCKNAYTIRVWHLSLFFSSLFDLCVRRSDDHLSRKMIHGNVLCHLKRALLSVVAVPDQCVINGWWSIWYFLQGFFVV